jgi:hypothetical protein
MIVADKTAAEIASERALKFFNEIVKDKKLGTGAKKKAMEMFPDVEFPEVDLVEAEVGPMREQFAKLKEELDAERAERAKEKEETEARKTKQSLEDKLDAARSKFSLTEDGFDKMVARMKETGNFSDADAAAAWVAQQTPAPTPMRKADWMPMRVGLEGDKSLTANEDLFKLLHTDPHRYEEQVLYEFVNNPDQFMKDYGVAA